ncbi:hypothetical protein MPLB_1120070 [Mesorhizobium sp. ORS 3324]|nr:hypothetical protein MPLB_1120070 [Mesorhizobium sp. ORS 3324]
MPRFASEPPPVRPGPCWPLPRQKAGPLPLLIDLSLQVTFDPNTGVMAGPVLHVPLNCLKKGCCR